MWFWFLCVAAAAVNSIEGAGVGAARLVCYVESARISDFNECTHLIYAGNARGEKLEPLLKEFRKNNPRLKIILRVTEADEDLDALLKSKNVEGLEVYDAHRSFNKTKITETVDAARAAVHSAGGGPLFLALPAHPELLAKYYDLRTLAKKTDLLMLHTHALGLVKRMTYHPSRLSGLWDMMNTDSVVDLVIGLGAPASKVVISVPATARQFSLQNETLSTPGSPATEDEPEEIGRAGLCRQLRKGNWTLERDQDLSAPYAFQDKTWISFEDSSSMDIKGKYARVRGLAGIALYDADRDEQTQCGPSLRTALAKVLNQQSRAPRAAVLRSLENEILAGGIGARAVDALQVSPYRITQVVDADGVIHSIREDTRTEFTCSRQGYFVHPRSCARFYRCVKFDQLSPEYTVFEFDCPAGLAFDSRYEVCVWPGSLPDSQACPGSSEIAPVPRTRFICPNVEGYYVDPENCRWFFACLDHGKSPLTAYEFRCPFGLGFDPARLTCDWPWLVPACAGIGRYEAEAFGFSGAALGGAAGFQGKTADSINIAGHQSLVSGASLNNLVGIQNSFLTSQGTPSGLRGSVGIDAGFSDLVIGSQGESSGISYNVVPAESINQGLLQNTDYGNDELYESGSLLLDNYRFSDRESEYAAAGSDFVQINSGKYQAGNNGKYVAVNNGRYRGDDSGKYRASQTGQYITSNVGKYKAGQDGKYVANNLGIYRANAAGKYVASDSGQYRPTQTGKYIASDAGKYRGSASGQYVGNDAGKYKGVEAYAGVSPKYDGRYQSNAYYTKDNRGRYIHNPIGDRAKPYDHVSVPALPYQHLDPKYLQTTESYTGYEDGGIIADIDKSGGYEYPKPAVVFNEEPLSTYNRAENDAVRIGFVGKTNLVDVDGSQDLVTPAVSLTQFGTNYENADGLAYATTPIHPVRPTTTSPIAFATPEPPKSSIKQIFTYNQPAVTVIHPTVVPIKQIQPVVDVSNYNQALKSTNVKLDVGVPYTTPTPLISEDNGRIQQTNYDLYNGGYQYSSLQPITEEPFKKVIAYTTGPSVANYGAGEAATYQRNDYNYQTTVSSTARPGTIAPSTIYENPLLKYTQSHKQQTQQRDYTSSDTGSYQYTGIGNVQPQSVIYSTAQPVISIKSTIQPVTFSEQNLHVVDGSRVEIDRDTSVSGYEYARPVQKFKTVISTPAPVTESYKSFNQQLPTSAPTPRVGVPYRQPSVSINVNPILKYTSKYSDASLVSSQELRQSFGNSGFRQGNDVVFVSTTPSSLIYEDHYSDYESPKKIFEYQPIAVKPKIDYQPIANIQNPSSVANDYNRVGYQSPEIQVTYKAEEYSPPLVPVTTPVSISITTKAAEFLRPLESISTIQPRVKTVEYFPPTQSPVSIYTSSKAPEYLPPLENTYLPPSTARSTLKTLQYQPTQPPVAIYTSTKAPEYLPPLQNTYLPPSTARPILKTLEYLPPTQQSLSKQITYDTFEGELPKSYDYVAVTTNVPTYSTRKQNIIVETAKSNNLLGFETVGTNAGLVSTTYSTQRPVVTSTSPVSTVSYQEPISFKGPDYLPPLGEKTNTFDYTTVSPRIKLNPFIDSVPLRKQNIVIESAKAQIVEADGELDGIEVSSALPIRRIRPKVAVVTKINDFNPLLVRKLGAVCSCQSPVLILKGKKPNGQIDELEQREVEQKSTRVLPASSINTITTAAPTVSSTLNPIIVPEDSFYEDYQDSSNINVEVASARNGLSESLVSSSPVDFTTQRVVSIEPRIKAVTTPAPTYDNILLNKGVAQAPSSAELDSQSFNRYGPGGWRGKDEILQGSVDCKRAGLFRHPKHCNKFYSCRWDCNKQRFTLHVFNCPIQLSFDSNIGACNWPSQGPSCQGDTLLTNTF